MDKKIRKPWSKRKRIVVGSLCAFAVVYIAVMLWHTYKPLPEGVSFKGDIHNTDSVEMITDLTYAQELAWFTKIIYLKKFIT